MKTKSKISLISVIKLEKKQIVFVFLINIISIFYFLMMRNYCGTTSEGLFCGMNLFYSSFFILYFLTFIHLFFFKSLKTRMIFGFLDTISLLILLVFSFLYNLFSSIHSIILFPFLFFPLFFYVGSVVILVLVVHIIKRFFKNE